jgi:hypothetical protein
MKRSIYLPNDLSAHVDAYLKMHRGLTFSRLVQEALEARVAPRDLTPLLELAGIVTEVSNKMPEQPEDQFIDRER